MSSFHLHSLWKLSSCNATSSILTYLFCCSTCSPTCIYTCTFCKLAFDVLYSLLRRYINHLCAFCLAFAADTLPPHTKPSCPASPGGLCYVFLLFHVQVPEGYWSSVVWSAAHQLPRLCVCLARAGQPPRFHATSTHGAFAIGQAWGIWALQTCVSTV